MACVFQILLGELCSLEIMVAAAHSYLPIELLCVLNVIYLLIWC